MLSLSIKLFASLNPAVSINRAGSPSMSRNSSIVSLVVPGVGATIARSLPRRLFKSVDLPTFGLPTMEIVIPSLRSLLCCAVIRSSSKVEMTLVRLSAILSALKALISSSGKSIDAST